MKIKTRILIIAMALVLLFMAGCSTNSKSDDSTTKTETEKTDSVQATEETGTTTEEESAPLTEIPLPIVNDGSVTLSYWVQLQNSDVIENWNDTLSVQELERLTGIHVEFIHPSGGQEEQAFSLLIASQDLPDIIQEREGKLYYPGGGDKAIADGVYLELSDLIENYAPNYKSWLESSEIINKLTLTDSGNRWGMFHLTEDAEPAWTGFAVRKDWLDILGLDTPVTLDDWHEMLTGFKNELDVESPLLVVNTGVPMYNHIISAFEIGAELYQVEGTVKYGPMQNEYKEYLAMMKQWYEEGILDQDFMGRTDAGFYVIPPENLAATGKAGAYATIWGRTADSYVSMGASDNPDLYVQAVPAPKMTEDQQIHFNFPSYQVRSGAAITSDCENPEIAMMWLDYQYSEEGSNIISYGAEGDTFELDSEGNPKFTQKVLAPEEEGLTAMIAYKKYCRWDGPGVIDYKRMWQIYNESGRGEALNALTAWAQDDISYVIPPVTMTDEEADEYANIMPDITTYVNEMTVNFIAGAESLDDFDSFVQQIKDMNIDRVIEIQQTALDRFNNRN